VLINSPRSPAVAQFVNAAAGAAGARCYAMLTPSLPVGERLRLLTVVDGAGCDLREFAHLADALGVACPTEENAASLDEVAEAMAEVAALAGRGALVVTLGRRGAIGWDPATRRVYRVSLTPRAAEAVAFELMRHPERVNGSGDRFFASFAVAHAAFNRNPRVWSRVKAALVQASVDVVRSYSSMLRPAEGWFQVRLFAEVG
jgi:hypothetical protein